jgi:N-acetyl-anhydromuramyl-L-alanine amidase AmpD
MITIRELKEMSTLGGLAEIEKHMIDAAKSGEFAVRIRDWINNELKDKLKEYGYEVSNDEGDTIISWED